MSTLNQNDVNALFSGLSRNYVRNNTSVAKVLAQNISSEHKPGQTAGSSSLLTAMTGKKSALTAYGKANTAPTPDWDQYLTKRKPEMTEDEYVAAIKAQAKKDKEAGVFQKGDGFNSLKMSYVSVASPDRQSIVANAQAAAKNGQSLGLLSQTGQYKDEKGQTVAMYGQGFGWMMLNTDAESARITQFMAIYNEAYYAQETTGDGEEAAETPQPEGGTLDVEA